jgi:hypothetical protein
MAVNVVLPKEFGFASTLCVEAKMLFALRGPSKSSDDLRMRAPMHQDYLTVEYATPLSEKCSLK